MYIMYCSLIYVISKKGTYIKMDRNIGLYGHAIEAILLSLYSNTDPILTRTLLVPKWRLLVKAFAYTARFSASRSQSTTLSLCDCRFESSFQTDLGLVNF